MPARHVSNVSSSTPAAIRFLLELGWFMELDSAAAVPDIVELVEFDSVAASIISRDWVERTPGEE
jgi:hypothetical protein